MHKKYCCYLMNDINDTDSLVLDQKDEAVLLEMEEAESRDNAAGNFLFLNSELFSSFKIIRFFQRLC